MTKLSRSALIWCGVPAVLVGALTSPAILAEQSTAPATQPQEPEPAAAQPMPYGGGPAGGGFGMDPTGGGFGMPFGPYFNPSTEGMPQGGYGAPMPGGYGAQTPGAYGGPMPGGYGPGYGSGGYGAMPGYGADMPPPPMTGAQAGGPQKQAASPDAPAATTPVAPPSAQPQPGAAGAAPTRGPMGYGPRGYHGAAGGHGMHGMHSMHGMMGRLPLNEEQRNKLADIADEQRRTQWALMGQRMEHASELRRLYTAERPDPKAIGAVYGKMFDLKRQMIEARLEAKNRSMDVLTEEQRNMLKQPRQVPRPPMGWQ